MTAMTTAMMNEYRFDLEDNALAMGIADRYAMEEAEEAERVRMEREEAEELCWAMHGCSLEEEEKTRLLLQRLREELAQFAKEGNREAWEETYDFFSDVSKDYYGFRWRLPYPFEK